MVKAAVILGAGASYDAYNGLGRADEDWQPPLVKELLGRAETDTFTEILRRYQGAMHLAGVAKPLTERRQEVGLEEQLTEFSDSDDRLTRAHFDQIPAYLRDLLWRVSSIYGRQAGSYSQLLYGLLAKTRHEVAFVTLNYDTILEQELIRRDPDRRLKSWNDYFASGHPARIFKLHGSVNWARRLARTDSDRLGPNPTWFEAVKNANSANRASLVEILPGPGEGSVWNDTRQPVQLGGEPWWMYPVLTAPIMEKWAIPQLVEHLRPFLTECSKYLVVGTSGRDGDLLDLLADSVQNVDALHYVGARDIDHVAKRFEARVNAFGDARLRKESNLILWGEGFRSYVSSPEFERFAAAGQ